MRFAYPGYCHAPRSPAKRSAPGCVNRTRTRPAPTCRVGANDGSRARPARHRRRRAQRTAASDVRPSDGRGARSVRAVPVQQRRPVARCQHRVHPVAELLRPWRQRCLRMLPVEIAQVMHETADPITSTPSSRSGASAWPIAKCWAAVPCGITDNGTTGTSASGYMRRNGTQTPWSSPWFSRTRGLRPASARRCAICSARSGAPGAG